MSAAVNIDTIVGRWTVIASASSGRGPRKWLCLCKCGTQRVVLQSSLMAGVSQSCGCARKETLVAMKTLHGGTGSAEYRVWKHMRGRCMDQNDSRFADYGGRGIKLCERWDSFENFLADVGPRPTERHSIERRDVNGDYEPSNVIWATASQQARNTRKTRFVEYNGEVIKLADLADQTGISANTLHKRAQRGSFGFRYVDHPS